MMNSIKNRGLLWRIRNIVKIFNEAAKDIYESGKLVGPLIAKTAAYGYFKGLVGL